MIDRFAKTSRTDDSGDGVAICLFWAAYCVIPPSFLSQEYSNRMKSVALAALTTFFLSPSQP